MMATDRQIEANRLNAQRSTGPRTAEGKERSRENAVTHGMAARSVVQPAFSDQLDEIQERWEREIVPKTNEERVALDAVVTAEFQIELCRRNLLARMDLNANRAGAAWDLDRACEASTLASKLAKNPARVASELQSTRHGVELMMQYWVLLGASLEANRGDWDEAEISTALDLLGVPVALRRGQPIFDSGRPDQDLHARRQAFVSFELDRLRALREEVLDRNDRIQRAHAASGALAMESREVKLILRYQREAWRLYDTMLKVAKGSAPIAVAVPEAHPNKVVAPKDEVAIESGVKALTASQTQDEILEIIAGIEARIVSEDEVHARRNEPNRPPVSTPSGNRHARRRAAAAARRG